MSFNDYFSKQSVEYAKFRPSYPPELFSYLANQVSTHALVWDVATGSGQAAVALAKYFRQVVATDASEAQIANAQEHSKVLYRVEAAEHTSFSSGSLDLVCVAQALHWFRLDEFFTEVIRVLKPGGVFAAWSYPLHQISPEIDLIVQAYYRDIVGSYWPAERRLVEERYRTITFPFVELKPPSFSYCLEWGLPALLGYLGTWSATQRYRDQHQSDPRELIVAALQDVWGSPEQLREIHWELTLRVGLKLN